MNGLDIAGLMAELDGPHRIAARAEVLRRLTAGTNPSAEELLREAVDLLRVRNRHLNARKEHTFGAPGQRPPGWTEMAEAAWNLLAVWLGVQQVNAAQGV
ncbi:hypothetical protein TSOC_014540 [Tetrabaena socialis]|uniref:Uncharacterized protein n=1 Tax=Tetrabaena socialis TaxID=47790 RepID=A0A2J7ZHC3_9CHLO|nr:hypothetical protein TSOC_014540 [Tetrabaena socialis]|eukprot:PNG99675.1 hypothetical protein TSOC_014540 [Tetrabaena socialis]